jgi:transposase-like protein
MPNSLFEVTCPACGAEMEFVAVGEGRCHACGASYLVRLGYLIPIDRRPALHPAGTAPQDGPR